MSKNDEAVTATDFLAPVSDAELNEVRAKYTEERNRRLRSDGNAQFIKVEETFRFLAEDPYADPAFVRAPLNDEVEIIVIGGGFGGMLAAARLRQQGFENIRIIEQGGDFGGTWYWNRYPRAQCDIESYVYLPLLEETNFIPREKYSFREEIFEHAQRIAKTFDLYRDVCFETKVTDAEWNDDTARWTVSTDRGDKITARYVIMSSGPLNKPKLPGIPGLQNFQGHIFHTSRWDYDYTGGSWADPALTKLSDKRVAIIGTGATGIQCIPPLGIHAEQLYVFQRTPSSVDLRNNKDTDPEWTTKLTPGWHQRRQDNFNALLAGGGEPENSPPEEVVADGWTDIFRYLAAALPSEQGEVSPEAREKMMESVDYRKMQALRDRVDSVVEDSATREKLKAWYRYFCKRPTFNDEYLPTFNRPNVSLIDTAGRGVERITEEGLVVDGVEYKVDCIIFATGFEVGTSYVSRSGFDIAGRDGKLLSEYWANGMRTLHGFYSDGFPNFFHMGFTQTGITPSVTHMLNQQALHIADVLAEAAVHADRVVEPSTEQVEDWQRQMRAKAGVNQKFLESCTPGYYNNEGQPSDGEGWWGTGYGGGPVEFYDIIRKWRADTDNVKSLLKTAGE